MSSREQIADAWDREYARGRYRSEPPLPFVDDIASAARRCRVPDRLGIYIGCGNGRNYLPVVERGLDLIGLDVSAVALEQLTPRAPGPHRLVHGDLDSLPPDERYGLVIGIQVFQHGDRDRAHRHIRAARDRVDDGGLLAIRVNATDTQLEFAHETVERAEGGGFSVRYLAGPKQGLLVHFFDPGELSELVGDDSEVELALRLDRTERSTPGSGHWSQWEAIWRRRPT